MRLPPECDGCSLAATAEGFCPPNPTESHTRLEVWGEAPGSTEIATGQGFTGAAGKLLREWLRRVGFSVASGWGDDMPGAKPQDVAFKNVVLCKRPGNVWPGKEAAWECLRRQQHHRPNPSFIDSRQGDMLPTNSHPSSPQGLLTRPPMIAYGANATETLTGLALPILKTRGSVLPIRLGKEYSTTQESALNAELQKESSTWLVASLHPAFLVRGGGTDNPDEEQGKAQDHLKPCLGLDARRALERSLHGPRVPNVSFVQDQLRLPPQPGHGDLVSIDIEGANGQPNIVGIASKEGRVEVHRWSEALRAWLTQLFEWCETTCQHNSSYDLPELLLAGVPLPRLWIDSINLAALYVPPPFRLGLEVQCLTNVSGTVTWKGLISHEKGPDYDQGTVALYRGLWEDVLSRLGRPVPRTGSEWYAFYNGLDTAWGRDLTEALIKGLKAQGRYEYYTGVMQPLQRPLLEAGLRGMPFDEGRMAYHRQALDRLVRMAGAKLARAGREALAGSTKVQALLLELADQEAEYAEKPTSHRLKRIEGKKAKIEAAEVFNPESNPQRVALLCGHYGLPPVRRRGRKGPSTDEQAIDDLISRVTRGTAKPKQGTVDEVLEVLRAMKAASVWSTWRSNFASPPIRRDGEGSWVVTQYNQHRTATGRFSSGMDTSDLDKAPKKGRAKKAQVQNIPERLRDAYIAPPGHVLVGGDWTALQLALYLWDAEEVERSGFHATLLDRLRAGAFDPHAYLASKAYGVPESEIGKKDWRRKNCKQFTFGLLFDGAGVNLARKAGLPDKVGRMMEPAHEQAFRTKKWATNLMASIKKRHYIQTPLGWRMYMWEWNPKATEAQARRIQAMEGDLFKWVAVQATKAMPQGWRWHTFTHDFLSLIVPQAEEAEARGWLKGQMEQKVPWLGGRSWLAEVRSGANWRVI